jgi:hypothetical protein
MGAEVGVGIGNGVEVAEAVGIGVGIGNGVEVGEGVAMGAGFGFDAGATRATDRSL